MKWAYIVCDLSNKKIIRIRHYSVLVVDYRNGNQPGSQIEHFQNDTDDLTPYRLILSHFRQHARFKTHSPPFLLQHSGSELGLYGIFPE
jgi:hypothetical protein